MLLSGVSAARKRVKKEVPLWAAHNYNENIIENPNLFVKATTRKSNKKLQN